MRRSGWGFAVVVAYAIVQPARSEGVPPVSFGEPTTLPDITYPYPAEVADVTGDGMNDVVLPNHQGTAVAVHAGNGDGTFADAVRIRVDESPSLYYRVARAARLNADSALDLVLSRGNECAVDILLSNAQGGFDSTTSTPIDATSLEREMHQLVDWDGDGDADILSLSNRSRLRVRANSDGVFGAPQNISLPDFPNTTAANLDLAFADLDGDTDRDLVLMSGNQFFVYWNGGAEGFTQGPTVSLPAPIRNGLAVADLDGDGYADLATITADYSEQPYLDRSALTVVLHADATTFAAPVSYVDPARGDPWSLAAADFNADGHVDLVTPTALFVNSGDGTFGPGLLLPVAWGRGVAVGNLDADPRPDIVLSGTSGGAAVVPVRASAAVIEVTSMTPATLARGVVRTATLAGSGFAQGAELTFGPGVTATQVVVDSPSSIRMLVDVATDAPLGAGTLSVRNPDGGAATLGYTVADPVAPALLTLDPREIHAGESKLVLLHGERLEQGATVSLGDGVTVIDESVNPTGTILAFRATVDLDADVGDRDAVVRNGSGAERTLPNAFVVLPPRSLDVVVERGRYRPPRGGSGGVFRVTGSFRFNALSPDGRFNAVTDGAVVRFGESGATLELPMRPDIGWSIRGSRSAWRSPRRTSPRVRLVLDTRKETFTLTYVGFEEVFDFSRMELWLGGETGVSERNWAPNPRGRGFVLR